MHQRPYYSMVVTSRNEGHGGGLLQRMRLFINGLLHQTRKFKLPMELVVVEWNPLPGMPGLSEMLPNPQSEDFLTVRYIIVPPEIHNRYKRASVIPLFQMAAKNVGIRRAKGEYVIASNFGLLFSDALFTLLAHQDLDPRAYYRANRNDIPDGIDESMTVDQQIQYAEKHIIRRNGWDSRYQYVNAHYHGLKEVGPISRRITDHIGRRDRMRQNPRDRSYYLLDTVACGDFTMMHHDAWIDIQGYAELDLLAWNIESLAVASAYALGYKQVTFPREACSFHIDHTTGLGSMSPAERLRSLEVMPSMDVGTVEAAALHLLEHHVRLNLNSEDWGFANESLQEIVFEGRTK